MTTMPPSPRRVPHRRTPMRWPRRISRIASPQRKRPGATRSPMPGSVSTTLRIRQAPLGPILSAPLGRRSFRTMPRRMKLGTRRFARLTLATTMPRNWPMSPGPLPTGTPGRQESSRLPMPSPLPPTLGRPTREPTGQPTLLRKYTPSPLIMRAWLLPM